MQGETENWLEQAGSDYKDARLLWENHRYGGAILFYQQAVEKILKGYIVEHKKKVPTKTHKVEFLLKEADLDISDLVLKTGVEELSKSYIRVRYPDLSRQYYRKREKSELLVKLAEQLYLWVKGKFKNH